MMHMNIAQDTTVTYPGGSTGGDGLVLWCGAASLRGGDLSGLITDRTPFHPLDHVWPDQPADTGWVVVNECRARIVDVLTGAIEKTTGNFFLDTEIAAKRGNPDWNYVVFHVLEKDSGSASMITQGMRAVLEVDEERRFKINMAHSACHLSALALNKVCKTYWQKESRLDSLGNPNFDAQFIQESRIDLLSSADRYRIGKSARKAGLNAAAVLEHREILEGQINTQLAEWIRSNEDILVSPGEAPLSAKRLWECRLSDGTASIPCGGSHAANLSEFSEVRVNMEQGADASEFTMHTTVLPS
jgi:alanyl-tRNA synthetase